MEKNKGYANVNLENYVVKAFRFAVTTLIANWFNNKLDIRFLRKNNFRKFTAWSDENTSKKFYLHK